MLQAAVVPLHVSYRIGCSRRQCRRTAGAQPSSPARRRQRSIVIVVSTLLTIHVGNKKPPASAGGFGIACGRSRDATRRCVRL
ncbi:hypothetical protein [Burkholderia sp. 22313]|uniref:hypothetical protein n=1 Tax=Burkholderia sp. 22313 TaxID=3453908 RepID=UPI002C8CFEAC|nr:hypothetical protein [Burkholderia sp.]